MEGVVGLICAIYAWREWYQREFAAALVENFASVSQASRRLRADRHEALAMMLELDLITIRQAADLVRHPDLAD